jgi:hypothetical protein
MGGVMQATEYRHRSHPLRPGIMDQGRPSAGSGGVF